MAVGRGVADLLGTFNHSGIWNSEMQNTYICAVQRTVLFEPRSTKGVTMVDFMAELDPFYDIEVARFRYFCF